jgi:hypothetical protein
MPEDPPRSSPPGEGAAATLPLIGLVMGVWAIIPPYLGAFGTLDVESRVEFADHVVPGIAVLVVSVLSLLTLRSRQPSQLLRFMAGGVIALAGFWMVATHFPLIQQGQDGISPWGTIAWHSVPGIAVTLFGLLWTVRFWGSDEADEGSATKAS